MDCRKFSEVLMFSLCFYSSFMFLKYFFWRRKISIISPCCIVVKIFSRGIATIMFFPCCLSRHRLKPLSKSAKCHERAWHQLASALLQRSFHSVDIFGIFHVIPTLTSNPFQPIQLISCCLPWVVYTTNLLLLYHFKLFCLSPMVPTLW